ncbi:hypothetical protein AEQU3_01684 [Aequorivita antarctica]|nr:hypothetical protein AEQU3_01684 [Aequorivita antarctica]
MILFSLGSSGANYKNALNVKQLNYNGYFVVFYYQRFASL